MAREDEDAQVDETVETTAVTPEPTSKPDAPAAAPVAARPAIDRRSLGFGAAAVALLVLAFVAGLAMGGDGHDRGERRIERMGGQGMGMGAPGQGGPGMGGQGGRDGGMLGGGERGGQMAPGGQEGRGGGGMRGGHGGGLGVVEEASSDELTLAPLGGPAEELVVAIGDDTEVKERGDDGARDLEDAEVSDIDEGDIVMVMGSRDGDEGDDDAEADDEDASSITVDADTIVIVRNGDE